MKFRVYLRIDIEFYVIRSQGSSIWHLLYTKYKTHEMLINITESPRYQDIYRCTALHGVTLQKTFFTFHRFVKDKISDGSVVNFSIW